PHHTSPAPRALHSFPTRRSSDLHGPRSAARAARTARSTSAASASVTVARTAPLTGEMFANVRPWLTSSPPTRQGSGRPAKGYGRSEEHTSELQSRSDLVCRLLLE